MAIVTSVIRPWLVGVEKDQRLIEDEVAKLQELMKKYPENPDLPMFAAQAKLRMAERQALAGPGEQGGAGPDGGSGQDRRGIASARTPTAAMYFSAAQVYQAQEGGRPAQRDGVAAEEARHVQEGQRVAPRWTTRSTR